MISFTIALAVLIAGYFTYGKFVSRVFGQDPARITPVHTRADGVDFVPLPTWKIFLIQFLNIAGLGPIFGAIMGVMYGPAAFLWIVFGTIFAGAVHDYLSGMLSLRNGGASLPEIVGAELGSKIKTVMRVFALLLMILVGAVFVYNPADLLASKIYACNAIAATDSIKNLSYRLIDVKMPIELAKELYNLYITDPSAYAFPANFARHFPGIYIKNSYGDGRVVEISSTMMRMYYHTTTTNSEGKETINRYQGNYYAVTPEIVLNNNLAYTISPELDARIADGEQIIVAPVGRDVELQFPIQEVVDYYNANTGSLSVVNTLTFDIPAEKITNDYGIKPPANLLLILSSKKDEFFLRNELNNNITSFYAAYDADNHRYRFAGMRDYLLDILKKDKITPEDYTFTLTPVTIQTEVNSSNSYYGSSTTYVSAIDPYIGAPAMVQLDLEKAKITLTFSKQTID